LATYMKNFKDFERKFINEPFRNIWSIKISPGAFNSKNLEDFIDNINSKGLINLIPVIDKIYKLVAFRVNIQKTIYIYTLKEWNFYLK